MCPVARRLAAVDEANLVLDHAGQVNVFLVAGLMMPGGFVASDGSPDLRALRACLLERIKTLPQLRMIPVPTGRRHRWVEVQPDLDYHIRLVGAVDGLTGLERTCGELMNVPMGLERPLWEILVVPGAAAGALGIVLRIHHAVADGMAAAAIVQRLFDPAEALSTASYMPLIRPTAKAGRRHVRHELARLRYGLRRTRMTVSGREVGPTVLLGALSPHRGVVFLDVDLAALEAHVRPLGATVNDGLLAAVSAGYRAMLFAAGERIPARLPVSVPVALQRHGTAGNQVGVMLVRLPLGEIDPDVRVRVLAGQTREEKVLAREQGTLEFMRGPVGARIMDRIGRRQHLVAGFVTNVPGRTDIFRLAGAPVVAIWPLAVLAANVRLGVAAVSYGGRLRCGIHFDADNVPGRIFAAAMGDELARLAT
ncbi:wax ester/triacylglycerol synthase domain-containing protein [Arthrobacter sulfonylureivorans]|uniref:wax ester/triacylglycerol synthase domain-containing protein n=1 Tax=Arthrobacter sulfonylureivorans TaxID=2486855 RepID=UPI0039E6DC29